MKLGRNDPNTVILSVNISLLKNFFRSCVFGTFQPGLGAGLEEWVPH